MRKCEHENRSQVTERGFTVAEWCKDCGAFLDRGSKSWTLPTSAKPRKVKPRSNYRPGMLSGGYKPGMRVEIRTKVFHLEHRKSKYGRVTSVNGGYILVRPMWCKWETECYPNELRKA